MNIDHQPIKNDKHKYNFCAHHKKKGFAKKINRQKKAIVLKAILFFHKIKQHIRGKKVNHCIIAGTSIKGGDILYKLICSCLNNKFYVSHHKISALDTIKNYHENILSNNHLDILYAKNIQKTFGSFRELLFLVIMQDPRELVTEIRANPPVQFCQGYDYQFFIKNNIKSFSNPSIGALHDAAQNIEFLPVRFLILKCEDVANNSIVIKNIINFATGWRFNNNSQCSNLFQNCSWIYCLKNQSVRPQWLENEYLLRRVVQQIALFPEMEQNAQALGYAPLDQLLSKYSITPPSIPHKSGTIVMFHTDDPIYRTEANRCIKTIEKRSRKYDLTVIPPQSSWVLNCAVKPRIIIDARRRIRGPILYIDVDTILHKDPWPYLSLYDGDMAVYVHHNGELFSGTIFINDTSGARRLLDKWYHEQKKKMNVWDQRVLQEIIEQDESNLKQYHVQRLPPNYTFIFDRRYKYIFGDIIIEHLQASREQKIKKNKKGLKRRKLRISQI